MYSSIQITNRLAHLKGPSSRRLWRCEFLVVSVVLSSLVLSPLAWPVSPPPDGGYPNENTAEGDDALLSLTTGKGNTAIGDDALKNATTGSGNTATGSNALKNNAIGEGNTAYGRDALFNNTGDFNTAIGFRALFSQTTGSDESPNTAIGYLALFNNTLGGSNTATGVEALFHNTTGSGNTATGSGALIANTIGDGNTADGVGALASNTTGGNNTAIGQFGLAANTTGCFNVALGDLAGLNLTGSNNIDIGNTGVRGESNTIRIGSQETHTGTFIAGISGVPVKGDVVVVNGNGRFGVVVSSARFKDEIKPMDKTSEAILALAPVTFRYKHEIDPDSDPQFGLIAEEVEKVNHDLVSRDKEGKPYTVRYEAVNAMLLNEFIKDHRQLEDLKAIVAKQGATNAQQQDEIKTLTTTVKEQAAAIQKVNAMLEARKPAPQVVANNQ